MRLPLYAMLLAAGSAGAGFAWLVTRSRPAPAASTASRETATERSAAAKAAPSDRTAAESAEPGPRGVSESGGAWATLADFRRSLARNAFRTPADQAELRALLAQAARTLAAGERALFLAEAGARLAQGDLGWVHDLLAQLGEFRDRHGFVRAIVEAAMGANPERATGWLGDLREAALRESAYQVAGMKWAERDVAAARTWAAGLADPAARLGALEGVTWAWTQTDATAAYAWAVALDDAALREPLLVKMAKLMAVRDPRQAVAWALQFPPGAARDEALGYAVFQWAADDLKGAADWAARVDDAALRSGGEVAIARSWSNQEAQGATQWAAGLRDEGSRATALQTTLRKWAEVAPAAAAQWVNGAGAAVMNEGIFRAVTGGLAAARPGAVDTWLSTTANPAWRAVGAQIARETVVPAPAAPRP